MTGFPHVPTTILKTYTEAFTGFSHVPSPDSLYTTFLSQECILGAASESGKGKQNAHSKHRGAGGEPPGASVQLLGPRTVTS